VNSLRAALLAFFITACSTTPGAPDVATSTAGTAQQAGLVDVATLATGIDFDIRYASPQNFTGAAVPGYEAPKCFLLRPVAAALARVQAALDPQGLRLRVFDCYRPVRSVQAFMRWVDDAGAQSTKPVFYPTLDKSQLRGVYIAPVSGHSRGATLDATLLQCDQGGACTPLDMGTPFDFFGPRANTDDPGISAMQRANRGRLLAAMRAAGFSNYPMEWWHFTFKPEPTPRLQYDVPVR